MAKRKKATFAPTDEIIEIPSVIEENVELVDNNEVEEVADNDFNKDNANDLVNNDEQFEEFHNDDEEKIETLKIVEKENVVNNKLRKGKIIAKNNLGCVVKFEDGNKLFMKNVKGRIGDIVRI